MRMQSSRRRRIRRRNKRRKRDKNEEDQKTRHEKGKKTKGIGGERKRLCVGEEQKRKQNLCDECSKRFHVAEFSGNVGLPIFNQIRVLMALLGGNLAFEKALIVAFGTHYRAE